MNGAGDEMGRRSQHTPEQLRTLIVDAARRIVETNGIAKLSAREIARAIGYAPGTLYNMFENLDEILLRVELQVLEELDKELERALNGASGSSAILRYATTYASFAHARSHLWRLLNEHQPTDPSNLPQWYVAAIQAPIVRLEGPLSTALDANDQVALRRAARTLWRMIHGMTMLTTSSKLGPSEGSEAEAQIKELVGNYLSGLIAQQGKRPVSGRSVAKTDGHLSQPR